MSPFHKQTGFTLVELLVAMVIGLLITLGALTLINSLFRTYNQVDELARQQERITFTVESMIRGVRNAQCWAMNDPIEEDICERKRTPVSCEDVDIGSRNNVSCIYENGRELQLRFDDGDITEVYKYRQSGSNLVEDSGSGDVVVVDGLQANGFLVCQGDSGVAQADTNYLFRMHFCLVGADCNALADTPDCEADETEWNGWLRFNSVSKSLAISKMLTTN